MNDWQDDKAWSDRFLVEIKRLLGEYLIGPAPQEEDAEHNTDLIVLRMDAVRVACRVRRHEYLAEYCHQFTIREGRPSGTKTELTKVIEGWGRYLFYGIADEAEQALATWALIDLNVFRLWFNRELVRNRGIVPGELCPNKDNSSTFRAFTFCELPSDLCVARQVGLEGSDVRSPVNGRVRDGMGF